MLPMGTAKQVRPVAYYQLLMPCCLGKWCARVTVKASRAAIAHSISQSVSQ